MYCVQVHDDTSNIPIYIEEFDAPTWQDALIAAAELAKAEPDSACDLGEPNTPRDTECSHGFHYNCPVCDW